QELRLASTGTGPLTWVTGAFYGNNKLHEDFYSDFNQSLALTTLTSYEQDNQSYGIFAQGNYQFNDRWKATLGLRPDREIRQLINLETLLFATTPFGPIANTSISNNSLS